ncbi:UPF0158 family protein [uncultured Paraglaciecola sp.]|uniref:UPF0158 family protein n=1 Tax=uncultured Paraglaciecola sp. TaxID=1765024 RepID=UPI002597E49F|nr:UPF0158 family protein [uncultured Paraglaciecola sp.]
MPAKLDDIEWAIEFSSAGLGDHEAYISLDTGEIYYVGDTVEEPIPDDLYECDRYLKLPSKQDLGLSKRLALSFIAESIPEELEFGYDIFSRRGAYAKFKSLLESKGKLEDWYTYEETALKQATIQWCKNNDVKINSGM